MLGQGINSGIWCREQDLVPGNLYVPCPVNPIYRNWESRPLSGQQLRYSRLLAPSLTCRWGRRRLPDGSRPITAPIQLEYGRPEQSARFWLWIPAVSCWSFSADRFPLLLLPDFWKQRILHPWIPAWCSHLHNYTGLVPESSCHMIDIFL